jgi:hypothetical protein
MKNKEVVVFALRKDTVTGKNEGESYSTHNIPSGVINVSHFSSPKIEDQQTYICIGPKAIKEGYARLELWLGHKTYISPEDLIREIKIFTRRNKIEPFQPPSILHINKVNVKVVVDMFNRMNANDVKKHIHTTYPDSNLLIEKTITSNKDTRLIFTLKIKSK